MKKYNKQLFWSGFVLNIVRKFMLVLAAVVSGIVGIWIKPCFYFGLGVIFVVLIWSFVQQLLIKHTVEHSDNPNFTPFANAMMSDNLKDEIEKLVENKVEKDQCNF